MGVGYVFFLEPWQYQSFGVLDWCCATGLLEVKSGAVYFYPHWWVVPMKRRRVGRSR
jgi:hypothetical protein